jgi:hypothetical protein
VATGPTLGNLQAGVVGSLVSVPLSIVSGGLACVAGVGVLALLVPEFHRFDARATVADEPGSSDDPPGDL